MDDEISKLKKIYGEDFLSEKSDSGAAKLTVNIRIDRKEGENGFTATAVIDCPADYPQSAPSVQVTSSSGLSGDVLSQMKSRLGEVATENKGPNTMLTLVRIVRRYLLDQRVHECPGCKSDLTGASADSWRSHCGHFYHRHCIISLIENSVKAQQENRPEGADEQAPAERRPVCPACGLYEFSLRDDKPVSRRIGGGGGGGRFRNRRGRNQRSGEGEGEAGGEGGEGGGDQRRRRPRRPPRNRGSGGGAGGENEDEAGEGVEGEGEAAPGQRRQRKRKPNSRRRRQQRSGGDFEGDGDANAEQQVEAGGEGGDNPKLFNRRRQADMRFNEFEQYRNQVGGNNGKGGGRGGDRYFPQPGEPGYIDEQGGFYAPDGYYYYDGPRGFYTALETYGGGGRGRGGGGRRRNRPRRPRGEGGRNGEGGGATEDQQPIQSEA